MANLKKQALVLPVSHPNKDEPNSAVQLGLQFGRLSPKEAATVRPTGGCSGGVRAPRGIRRSKLSAILVTVYCNSGHGFAEFWYQGSKP